MSSNQLILTTCEQGRFAPIKIIKGRLSRADLIPHWNTKWLLDMKYLQTVGLTKTIDCQNVSHLGYIELKIDDWQS